LAILFLLPWKQLLFPSFFSKKEPLHPFSLLNPWLMQSGIARRGLKLGHTFEARIEGKELLPPLHRTFYILFSFLIPSYLLPCIQAFSSKTHQFSSSNVCSDEQTGMKQKIYNYFSQKRERDAGHCTINIKRMLLFLYCNAMTRDIKSILVLESRV